MKKAHSNTVMCPQSRATSEDMNLETTSLVITAGVDR